MIEGALVNLRAQEETDLERIFTWINDREVTRHLNARYPASRLAEEGWLRERASAMPSYTNAHFAIETKDGTHIGGISFHKIVPEGRKARFGMMIGDKRYWSKGYGTDALLTFLRFGFDQMNLHRIDLDVDVENARAIACYQKCGFIVEGRRRRARYARGAYEDQLVMGILDREFYEMQAAPSRGHDG